MSASEVLLINPRPRRKARKGRKRNPSPAQLRARAKFAAAARARSGASARRANPAPRRRSLSRRRNPAPLAAYRRRRRNPIGGLNLNSIMSTVKAGAIRGIGAVAADIGYAQIARFLPSNLQAGPGQVTAGTAVKMLITAAAGRMLSRATKGVSTLAAEGALTVQFRDLALGLMPQGLLPGMVSAPVAGRFGYGVPAPVVNYSGRTGPNRTQVGAYTRGKTPLLSAYTNGPSPLLSARTTMRAPMGRAHR